MSGGQKWCWVSKVSFGWCLHQSSPLSSCPPLSHTHTFSLSSFCSLLCFIFCPSDLNCFSIWGKVALVPHSIWAESYFKGKTAPPQTEHVKMVAEPRRPRAEAMHAISALPVLLWDSYLPYSRDLNWTYTNRVAIFHIIHSRQPNLYSMQIDPICKLGWFAF